MIEKIIRLDERLALETLQLVDVLLQILFEGRASLPKVRIAQIVGDVLLSRQRACQYTIG